MSTSDAFRDWKPDEWFDRGFLSYFPAKDRAVCLRKFRPLSDELSERVRQSLFVGIKKPWHYQDTTGWMKRLLHEGLEKLDPSTFEEGIRAIKKRINWAEPEVVIMEYNQTSVYATKWGSFLSSYSKGHIYLDNLLVCQPIQRDVVLFWEDYCDPYFGKRGPRELPKVPWDQFPESPWVN